MWCPDDETLITRELNSGVEDLSIVGLRRLKRRKCERWFVPNWDSKPSFVNDQGAAIMPALLTITFSLSVFERRVVAAARTLSSDDRSSSRSSTRPDSRYDLQAS